MGRRRAVDSPSRALADGDSVEARPPAPLRPPPLRFRWPWRPYQARVLASLEAHLADGRLHVVAAPGSGKTVLGLELFRRLGRPALALSPTRTIRDQWIARLADFRPPGDETDPRAWTSTRLDDPAYFTSITYQALHAHAGCRDGVAADRGVVDEVATNEEARGEAETEGGGPPAGEALREVASLLRRRGVGTLILDEAHHLTRAWWAALTELLEELPDVTVVSLTATPPYDALGREWRRYEALCGPVDEEISVPELVRSGTLCPHQDYVWTVAPGAAEAELLRDREAAVTTALAELGRSPALVDAVRSHPWIRPPAGPPGDAMESGPAPAEVLEDIEVAASLLVYLKARGEALPRPLLALLGAEAEELPALDRRWWEVLLRHYLFGALWSPSPERVADRDALKRRLRELGLLWRRELRLTDDRVVTSRLSLSPAKLDACVAIHGLERAQRGAGLRQVFLTDYIREDDPDRLGAWPLFLRLADAAPAEERPGIALVTGGMAVVHEAVLLHLPARDGSPPDPVGGAPGFVRLRHGRNDGLVTALTHALEEGTVRVLVGTRGLLGEGWDAPSVNSLVIASYAGSFVSANQMRGRAIRRSARDPEKVASIWHLAAVDASSPAGLSDWEALRSRFRAFVGVSAVRPVIESGLERLALPEPAAGASPELIAELSAGRLAELPQLEARWSEAIDGGGHGRVAPVVRVRKAPRRPTVLFWRTLQRLALTGALAGFAAFEWVLRTGAELRALDEPVRLLAIAALVGAVASLPGLVRAAWLWARTLPVDGAVRQVGLAVRDALAEVDALSSDAATAEVEVRRPALGAHALSLAGGSFLDQSVFADAVAETLGPVEDPRYLVTRGRGRRRDYHAVPTVLGTHAHRARAFHRCWEARLGRSTLVYTRSPQGRSVLLRARSRSFSSAFVPPAERLDRWQ